VVVEALKKALGTHWPELGANGQAEVLECVEARAENSADLGAAVRYVAFECDVNARSAAAVIRSRAQSLKTADLSLANMASPRSTSARASLYRPVSEVMLEAEGVGTRTKDPQTEIGKLKELLAMTKNQRQALEILTASPEPVSAFALSIALGTSPQGAARTASSLVTQGVAYRIRIDRKVHYASKLR
jgi:hypothetical protein